MLISKIFSKFVFLWESEWNRRSANPSYFAKFLWVILSVLWVVIFIPGAIYAYRDYGWYGVCLYSFLPLSMLMCMVFFSEPINMFDKIDRKFLLTL